MEGIGAALGDLPDVVEAGSGFYRIPAQKLEFGDRYQRRQLTFDHVDGAGASQSVMQALIGA
jgi:hypothetical protein